MFLFYSKVEEISSWELNEQWGWVEMRGDDVEECKRKDKNEILWSLGENKRENRRVCKEDLKNPLRSGDI